MQDIKAKYTEDGSLVLAGIKYESLQNDQQQRFMLLQKLIVGCRAQHKCAASSANYGGG